MPIRCLTVFEPVSSPIAVIGDDIVSKTIMHVSHCYIDEPQVAFILKDLLNCFNFKYGILSTKASNHLKIV